MMGLVGHQFILLDVGYCGYPRIFSDIKFNIRK